MGLERKDFSFRITNIKAATADTPHELEGYASVFGGTPDSYGDLIAKGAFTESLRIRTPHFLWQHNQELPIGKAIHLEEDEHGLFGRWQLANTAQAKDAYEYMKEGLVQGLSIGFMAQEWDFDQDANRILRKIDLREISAVTIPASDVALISAVKSDIPTDQLCKQATEALRVAVREVEALHERRSADGGRTLNDRQREAVEALVREAKAAATGLAALVTPPDAEAKGADSQAHGLAALELDLATRKLRRMRTRFAPAFTGVA